MSRDLTGRIPMKADAALALANEAADRARLVLRRLPICKPDSKASKKSARETFTEIEASVEELVDLTDRVAGYLDPKR